MSAPIPSTEPTHFVAGNTVQWTKSLPDYPADQGWVLSYAFVSVAGIKFSVTASASGSEHLVTIAAATSAGYTAGTWYWQSYATLASVRNEVATGTTEIKPNFAAQASTYDARSTYRRWLDLIQAAIDGRLPDGLESYNIGGVDIRLIGQAQLFDLYDRILAKALLEEQGAGGKNRNVYIRFGTP